jgi:dipeptidyl aminopeptidase/acylaminoacyl peptidase
MFAAWSVHAGQANLEVRDLQGNLIATVATIKGTPERAAIWLGSDRLAYVDGNGTLNVVDLHGNSIALPQQVKVTHGSVEASPSGGLIAVDGVEGPVVLDLAGAPAKPLPSGATGFDWSAKGDLAFLVQQPSGSDLYVAADGKQSTRVASSPAGQTWSDLNWAPDASSLLLATKPADSSSGAPSLLVVNRDGSHMVPFGAHTEYTAPEWSPDGNLVLFTRHDDATGGVTFQVATVSISGTNSAEQQAIAEVDRFMKARLAGDRSGALAELDSNGQAAFQSSGALLTSAAGSTFDRYYPVTVQLTRTTPSTFLIGVRTFIAKPGGAETSFFEEQLTVVQQDQRYLIHDVQASPSQPLSHGPTVVSVEVLQTPPGQQIRVRFDADLKAETVTNGTVQVKTQDGTLIQSQVTFDPETHLATLAVKLRPGTYQLVVTIGVSDINNVPLAQEYDAPLVISR